MSQGKPKSTVLGVERSHSGRRWSFRTEDERSILAMSQRFDLPDSVSRALVGRGVDMDTAEQFLSPRLRDMLPDPSTLADMDKAAARFITALEKGEKVAVFGDYDVDGATSSALLYRYMCALGKKPRVYIPDRIREGYGPNAGAMETLAAEKVGLVITVDCGTLAFEALRHAKALGLDVIVLDHHQAEAKLPEAVAVVNPNRLDDTSGQGMLAAVGVTFLFLVACNRLLRRQGWFSKSDQKRDAKAGKALLQEPDLVSMLDIVALGTVCDVVPLRGLNRAFVAQGLKVLARRQNLGLRCLSDVAALQGFPNTYHLGFLLGPRLNAGGRIGESELGFRLLAGEDVEDVMEIALHLDALNKERQIMEAEMLDEALEELARTPQHMAVFAAKKGWHPGIVGILASRLKDRFVLPSFVIGFDETGLGKGSVRSLPGIDIGAVVVAAQQAGLLESGGGHAMAAGLAIREEKFQAFQDFVRSRLEIAFAKLAEGPKLGVDALLSAGGATLDIVDKLSQLEPFGAGNSEPRFAFERLRVEKADLVGKGHVRAFFRDHMGNRLQGIAFRAENTDIGNVLLAKNGIPIHVCGKLRVDEWNSKWRVQLIIDDTADISFE